MATIALLASVLSAGQARAAGLYFSDRGVRPLGRGGAFVAGADDLSSIWYNPAGLADTGTSFLFDASQLAFNSSYTRQSIWPTSTGTELTTTFPTVQGSTPILPIPTIAGSYAFGERKEWTVAAGVFAPYTPIASYPEGSASAPSPQRYSLVSLSGSALVVTGAWASFKPIEQIRIGAGIQALVGSFQTLVDFTASAKDSLMAAPEDPNYDALSRLTVGPIFAPSGNAGVTVVPAEWLHIGASGQLPFHIDSPATIQVRLPQASLFDPAYQQGTNARVQFNLPAVLRAGIELRPRSDLRVEVAYVHEFWSTHRTIDITPNNIQLYNVTGLPSPFAVSPISIPRNFQDSNSVRFGGEFKLPLTDDYAIQARAGLNYETSAIPVAYVSPLTIDSTKITPTVGGSLYIGDHWRFDLVLAHVFMNQVTVNPADAKVPQVNPVRGNPTNVESVNGGTYTAYANIIGGGLNYRF